MPQIGPMSFKCRQPPSLAVSPFLAVVLRPSPSLSLSRVISQQTALSQFGCTLGLGSSALLQTVSHQCATARHYRLQSNCHTPQGTLSKGTNPASTPSPPTLAFKKKKKTLITSMHKVFSSDQPLRWLHKTAGSVEMESENVHKLVSPQSMVPWTLTSSDRTTVYSW